MRDEASRARAPGASGTRRKIMDSARNEERAAPRPHRPPPFRRRSTASYRANELELGKNIARLSLGAPAAPPARPAPPEPRRRVNLGGERRGS
ncbi:hypothetical protein EVAR_778_1 [Eumeta japonica]|uniref:Uncharacterized protein n=1 Tax=Eumeta variegata TaxID=151549 RepID=A0A4C1SF06_EUMVA|nr:hypothetical protein EVAR_778_1 [Eumeta japonica]